VTTSKNSSSLTIEAFAEMMNNFRRPVLYYGTSENIEQGTIYTLDKTDMTPETMVCHPDDLEEIKQALVASRRLVHLKDRPIEEFLSPVLTAKELMHMILFDDDDSP